MSEEPEAETTPHVRARIAAMILAYVDRALGSEGVGRVLRAAGHSHPMVPSAWATSEEILALAEAAGEACGDPAIGRRAGEEHMRSLRAGTDFLRAEGSVEGALRVVADVATKMSEGRIVEVSDVGDGYAIITGQYVNLGQPHPFFCDYTAGCFVKVTQLFGFVGAITEPQCMCRGAQRCEYRVSWVPRDTGGEIGQEEVEASKQRVQHFVERFEQLHTMATELAQAEEIDTVLERITERASTAVKARRHLLAVRTHEGAPARIHARNFDPDAADHFAEQLLAGPPEPDERHVVAEVSSTQRRYGYLAAIFPEGAQVSDLDRRLLDAYARHAAAALEAVASLEVARADRDTARALLGLARALAEVGSTADVAHRLAAAVPAVTGCDRSDVWLWDADRQGLRLEATFPQAAEPTTAGAFLAAKHYPELLEQITDAVTVMVSVDRAGPRVRRLMENVGLRRGAIVPIRVRGDMLGAVTAGFREPALDHDRERVLLARLKGMADQAATAMDNAQLLERVRDQALHDGLTGLPNRMLMEDRAKQLLAQASRSGAPAALLFIDLDRFKNVNDTLGHGAGDRLIQQAAERLGQCVRASDVPGRLGGDEFVVLLPDTDAGAAKIVADKILVALEQPFVLDEGSVHISASIGIATAPEHGRDYSSLLQHADMAMYSAKQAGRSAYAVHGLGTALDRRERLELENDLREALDRRELCAVYQPQVDLRSREVVGVEALVRWNHPRLGRLSPDRFIPLAEESGLIADIDDWMWCTAFQQARDWNAVGMPLRMAVNLSTRGLHDATLPGRLEELLRRFELDPAIVELEVTDRIVMGEEDLPGILAPLHEVGVRLAIDDFGIGSSVRGRLQRCPVDTVKIDRSFVHTITAAEADAPVVTALLSMAQRLDLDIVAEGVEIPHQASFLRHHGCHVIQGFFFSPPLEAPDVAEVVRNQRAADWSNGFGRPPEEPV